MKTEDPPPTPPVTTFSAAQWGTSQIPIDPALQQQSQHPTTTYPHYQAYQHYPQASYSHYQQYVPPQAAQQTQQPAVASISRPAPQANAMDTADIATLNDALGSAGVDLRAEEETLHRAYEPYAQTYRPYEDRTRKQPPTPNFNTTHLSDAMRALGEQHKVTKVPEDTVNYMALALRARLQDLIVAMTAASEHRTDTQFDRPASQYSDGSPMWSIAIRSDVGKQLAAMEKVERDEEVRVRRERKERAEAAAAQHAALAAQAGAGMSADGGYDDEGGPKKKRKKDGPGVTARNMSEDVRKKMSNAVASQAAGLGTGKYAWMTAANVSAPPSKPKPATSSAGSSGGATTPATTTTPAMSTTNTGRWARPYVPTRPSQQQTPQKEEDPRRAITLRDAMFVIEKEKGHGGGRGSVTGWT